jgi:hypothetical protein
MHRNLILFISIFICFLASCEEGFDLNSGVTLSDTNELYTLELNVSSNATKDLSPVQFNAKVTRHSEYTVRSDSKVIGYWKIYLLTIDGDTVNVAQFPTYYDFFSDQSFDKIEESSIGGDTQYTNGGWTADMSAGMLALSIQGMTTNINVTFDYDGDVVPLDGFMIWDFEKDGKSYHQVLQKYEYTDMTEFTEYVSYLSISATGGTLEGINEPSLYDIIIQLPNEVNASYEVSGSFVPLFDFYEGALLATLYNENYTVINVNIPIKIEITIY